MNRYPRSHIKIAFFLASVLAVVITTLPAKEKDVARFPILLEVEVTPEITEPAIETEDYESQWTELSIAPGDNLSKIFKRLGLPAANLQEIVDIGPEVAGLRRILPGKELGIRVSHEGKLIGLRYSPNVLNTLVVQRKNDTFEAQKIRLNTEYITAYQTATIDKEAPSLYLAGKRAGLSDNIIMQLSYVFQWDISFALDMRQGDSFALLYEEIYANGKKLKDGEILAASFSNMGKAHTAVRYKGPGGRTDYYTPDGLSLRKAFIRDPVHFSHVSSRFNLRRLHPIHKRVMPHRGIDYAANRGTPVIAAGDGKVSIARQNNASGKYVVLQHGQQYTTKYLHLSRFAKGIRTGTAVRQGQTIGYVGSTGWATAPHLHFEFLVSGVHRNPYTVKLPKADPIPANDISDFRNKTSGLLIQLAAIQGKTGYARLETPEDAGASE
ncbi:MAG TPA: peptidase M23 [Gammaproteobacteria bacterium]|nr:peptidase M23 [Gammaproteobacteria bacterium]